MGRRNHSGNAATGDAGTRPFHQPGPPSDITVLDDHEAWRLLAPVMDAPGAVWAYASAVTVPGDPPVDEVLLAEISGADQAVVWVRHPGSYTGATGHLLGGTGDDHVSLLRRWERAVFELADLVASSADQTSPSEGLARVACIQADHLRWAACYGVTVALAGLARDRIRDIICDNPSGAPAHDLGDLPPDGAAQIAAGISDGPTSLIPPGWDLHGWDYTRPRTYPILSGLRPDSTRPIQGTG